jgi:hypothetical protein
MSVQGDAQRSEPATAVVPAPCTVELTSIWIELTSIWIELTSIWFKRGPRPRAVAAARLRVLAALRAAPHYRNYLTASSGWLVSKRAVQPARACCRLIR